MIGIVLDAPALIAMLKGKTGAVIGHRYCSEITRCAQLAFATSKGICFKTLLQILCWRNATTQPPDNLQRRSCQAWSPLAADINHPAHVSRVLGSPSNIPVPPGNPVAATFTARLSTLSGNHAELRLCVSGSRMKPSSLLLSAQEPHCVNTRSTRPFQLG
jgi:hypothetical protein